MPVSKKPRRKKSNPSSSKAASTAVTLPDRRAMEGFMSAIGGGRTNDASTAKAQEVMYEAWDQTSQRARVALAMLMLSGANLLVLDEPTNHLDLEAINALNIALQRYQGTVFLVTHDHDLIDEVATRIWHFDHGHIEDFKGPYEEYVAYSQEKAS